MIDSMIHRIPNVGNSATHFWESPLGKLPLMGDSPRQLIAVNLARLMEESKDLYTLERLSVRCGISRGTLDRIRRALVSTGVDQLEAIGKAFDLEPYELMTPHAAKRHRATPPPEEARPRVVKELKKIKPPQSVPRKGTK